MTLYIAHIANGSFASYFINQQINVSTLTLFSNVIPSYIYE